MNLMLQLHEFFFRLSNSVYYFQCIIKISVLFSLTFFFVILFRIFIFFMYVLRMRINFGSFAIFTLYSSTSLVRSRKYIRAHWGVLRTFFLTRSLSHVLSLSLALCVCACERYSFDSLAYSLSLSRSLYARLCVMRSLWACAIHPSIHPHVWFYTLIVWHKWVLVQRFSISNGSNIYWKQTTYGMWMNANFWRADAAYNLALFGIWWCSFFLNFPPFCK